MKKMKKAKKLFIDDLEIRRSTSPLLIQTMAVGEAGVASKQSTASGSSAEKLASGQKAKEDLVSKKNTPTPYPLPTDRIGEAGTEPKPDPKPRMLYGIPDPRPRPLYGIPDPKFTTAAIGEEGTGPKPPIVKYAAPNPTPPINVKYAAPNPTPPINVKYAAPNPSPVTTKAIGEEGKPPKPVTMRIGEGRVGPKPITSAMIGEEGTAPKPPKPITTLAVGEEGKSLRPR